jgi:ABC-type multidrug transport system fused ATPase/permease subunit
MDFLIKIFKENYFKISLVYFYSAIGNLLVLFEPYLLGKMIDGIIIHEYKFVFLFSVNFILLLIFGYIRRVIDTKIFTKISNKYIVKHIDNNIDKVSKNVSRSNMVKYVIGFLENNIPHSIFAIYSIFGSIIFIFNLNLESGIILSFFIIPVFILIMIFYKKMKKVNILIHNNSEEFVDKLNTKNISIISSWFNRDRNLNIKYSNIQATNWGLYDLISFLFVLIVLIYYVGVVGCTVGSALMFYNYVKRFTDSLSFIPDQIDSIIKLKDISKRF